MSSFVFREWRLETSGERNVSLLSLVETGRLTEAERLIETLMKKQIENETIVSMQEMALALQAIPTTSVPQINSPYYDVMDVRIKCLHSPFNELTIAVNKPEPGFQKVSLNPSERNFQIMARGKGLSALVISYWYNVDNDTSPIRTNKFTISNVHVSHTTEELIFNIDFCMSYVPDDESTASKAVLEVNLPSYCRFRANFREEMEFILRPGRLDEDMKSSASVYFDHLNASNVCPKFIFSCKAVHYSQPGSIRVYDYSKSKKFVQKSSIISTHFY